MNHSRYFRPAAMLLAVCLILGGCGSKTPSTTEAETTLPPTTEAPTTQPETTLPPTTEEPTTEPATEEPTTEPEPDPVVIEQQVIADKDKIKIVATEFVEDENGAAVKLSIDNGTDHNITIYYSSLIVNNYVITEPDPILVEKSKTAESMLALDRGLLDSLGIAQVGLIKVDYNIIDTDDGSGVLNPDTCEIRTNYYETMTDAKEWTGTELYKDNDLTILLTDSAQTPTGGAVFSLYIENASKDNINLIGDHVLVNGRAAEVPILWPVYAGMKTLRTVTVSRTAMDRAGIGDTVDSFELALKVRGSDWKVMFETGAMVCNISGNAADFGSDAEADTEFVSRQLILDESEIMAAVRGWVVSEEFGPGLKLQLKNYTDSPVRFLVDTVVVDDYVMNNCRLVVPMDAADTVDAVLYLDQETLKLIGIEEIGTVELGCSLQDGETFEEIKSFDPVKVETSAKENVKVVSEKKGVEIYNEKKLKLVVIGYSLSETNGVHLYLWAKNSSDKTMVLSPVNVKLNDIGVLGLGEITVLPGKMAVSTYTVPPVEVSSHGVTDFKGIVLNSEVCDTEGKLQFTTLYGGLKLK